MSSTRQSTLLLFAVLLMLMPFAYAELEIPPPFRHNFSAINLEGITILDSSFSGPVETFEWDDTPCDGGGTAAYFTGDDFECGWTYWENPDPDPSGYMEIEQTTDTNWGSYAAWWDGPDVGIMEKTEVQGL